MGPMPSGPAGPGTTTATYPFWRFGCVHATSALDQATELMIQAGVRYQRRRSISPMPTVSVAIPSVTSNSVRGPEAC